jgi:hypothetical protein
MLIYYPFGGGGFLLGLGVENNEQRSARADPNHARAEVWPIHDFFKGVLDPKEVKK